MSKTDENIPSKRTFVGLLVVVAVNSALVTALMVNIIERKTEARAEDRARPLAQANVSRICLLRRLPRPPRPRLDHAPVTATGVGRCNGRLRKDLRLFL